LASLEFHEKSMRADSSLKDLRIYRFDRFRLNTNERTLRRDGQLVAVSPKAWEVLKILLEQGGGVVDKQFLMDSVWPETFVEENNLAFNISVLRKVLGDEAAHPRFISLPVIRLSP
jgi:DNA-binding winged helix-turn-helix (wHTH) protein